MAVDRASEISSTGLLPGPPEPSAEAGTPFDASPPGVGGTREDCPDTRCRVVIVSTRDGPGCPRRGVGLCVYRDGVSGEGVEWGVGGLPGG